jgi:hypothetical protein
MLMVGAQQGAALNETKQITLQVLRRTYNRTLHVLAPMHAPTAAQHNQSLHHRYDDQPLVNPTC